LRDVERTQVAMHHNGHLFSSCLLFNILVPKMHLGPTTVESTSTHK